MRAADLLPPILNERHSLRRRRRRGAHVEAVTPQALVTGTNAEQATPAPSAFAASDTPATPHGDPAVERARRAGGPIDNACYACSCGLVFAAAVSTTVSCPRCGADQGW